MIDESQGRRVLKEAFEEAGFTIQEDFPFRVAGSLINLDGYDSARRNGYEYITTASGDRGDLNDEVLEELNLLNAEGVVQILLIDEHFIVSEEELRLACQDYLEELSLDR